mgnify:CR=1 FL=1
MFILYLFNYVCAEICTLKEYVVHRIDDTIVVKVANRNIRKLISAEICTLKENVVHRVDTVFTVLTVLAVFTVGSIRSGSTRCLDTERDT